ncbi:MAG: hypothetical protein ACYSUI_04055 [Planctomycetota bacterium]
MRVGRFCWMLGGFAVATCVGPAVAQEQSSKAAKEEVHRFFDVPSMINQAVMNISRRYNLNKEQHEITQRMMQEGVNGFLREHQDEIYPLIRDLAGAQLNPGNMSVAQRKRIGKAARPLVEAAKKVILDRNAEWRKILSEEQKRLHDWDLTEMEGQFGQIHDNFEQMQQGAAVDNPIFNTKPPTSEPPPTPPRPAEKKHAVPPGPAVVRDGVFDRCVEKFIKDYGLDPGQIEAARSIGREYKGYADVYRKVHAEDYQALQKKQEQARRDGDLNKAQEAEQEEERLNARILKFLEDMKGRLATIPREAQKLAYQKKQGTSGARAAQTKTTKKAPVRPTPRKVSKSPPRGEKKDNEKPAGKSKTPADKDE